MVEIRFGEGGKDSKLFIKDLFAAYVKYADFFGVKAEQVSYSDNHLVAIFKGEGVGKIFQHESGAHCCQRCPPTENKGRHHTSIVSVGILPMPNKNLPPINENDLEIKTQRGHGPGGQHQNKTNSAIRMKHKPTGISVFINGRDQCGNRREALRIITAKVDDHYKQENDEEYADLRKQQMGDGGRGNKIRTYNFIKSRVVDHRLKNKTKQIKQIMKGQFWRILGDDFDPKK